MELYIEEYAKELTDNPLGRRVLYVMVKSREIRH